MSPDRSGAHLRVPLIIAAIILVVAGLAGWIVPWGVESPESAPAPTDIRPLVTAQRAVAEIADSYAALSALTGLESGAELSAVLAASRELEGAFLAAIEQFGDEPTSGDAESAVDGQEWQSLLDSLLVLGFEESRAFSGRVRSWQEQSRPAVAEVENAVRPLAGVVAELRSVVYDAELLAGSLSATDAGAGGRATVSSAVSLAGLIVIVIAGLVLVMLTARLRPVSAGGTGAGGFPAGRGEEAVPPAGTGAASGSMILSDTDPVTGAEGRSVFERTLRGEISRTQRYAHPLTLLVYSVDQLASGKMDGDSADYVLGTIGEIVQNNIRVSDVFARLADNVFVILLAETPQRGAERVAEKLRRNIEVFPFDDVQPCTVSVGTSVFQKGDSGESLLARAETACQTASSGGGNRVSFG